MYISTFKNISPFLIETHSKIMFEEIIHLSGKRSTRQEFFKSPFSDTYHILSNITKYSTVIGIWAYSPNGREGEQN